MEKIQQFEGMRIRSAWNEEKGKWYFSIVDVVSVLTDSKDPKQYVKKIKARDPELASRWGTICTLTRMRASDGKSYQTQTSQSN